MQARIFSTVHSMQNTVYSIPNSYLPPHILAGHLRQAWGKVIAEGKKAVDQKSMLAFAEKQLAALDSLLAAMAKECPEPETCLPENLPSKLLQDCSVDLPNMSAELASMPEAGDIGTKLNGKLQELKDFVQPRFKSDITTLTSWLSNLWVGEDDNLQVASLNTVKDIYPRVTIMSTMAQFWFLTGLTKLGFKLRKDQDQQLGTMGP